MSFSPNRKFRGGQVSPLGLDSAAYKIQTAVAYTQKRFKFLSDERSPERNSQKLVWRLHSQQEPTLAHGFHPQVSFVVTEWLSPLYHVHIPGSRKVKRGTAKGHFTLSLATCIDIGVWKMWFCICVHGYIHQYRFSVAKEEE